MDAKREAKLKAREIADKIQDRVGEEMTLGCWSALQEMIVEVIKRAEQRMAYRWDKIGHKKGLLRAGEVLPKERELNLSGDPREQMRIDTWNSCLAMSHEAIRREANEKDH